MSNTCWARCMVLPPWILDFRPDLGFLRLGCKNALNIFFLHIYIYIYICGYAYINIYIYSVFRYSVFSDIIYLYWRLRKLIVCALDLDARSSRRKKLIMNSSLVIKLLAWVCHYLVEYFFYFSFDGILLIITVELNPLFNRINKLLNHALPPRVFIHPRRIGNKRFFNI